MQIGHLALLLHAHLPFVRHPEHEDFLEEEWFFEAVAETYLPLLKVFFQLAEEEVPFRITMTLTPTLCAMLRDSLLQDRARRYLERGLEISRQEMERTASEPKLQELARFYYARFSEAHQLYVEKWRCDLLHPFALLQQAGHLELITSAATHGFLPLMDHTAMRAQIRIGIDYHIECFGQRPTGIWLPECAYVPSLDKLLFESEIRWFLVETHGALYGHPRPRFAVFAPYYTPSGPAFFARDRTSSKQVWSANEGYPGDPAYRDFYRDIGYDLPETVLEKYIPLPKQRRPTGFKYYRVTGSPKKQPYFRPWAMAAADAHAQHFMESRVQQIDYLRQHLPISPIVTIPFDAELFGHWWFEGPEFLDLFLRKSAFHQASYRLSTPSEYLAAHPTLQIVSPASSSWGNKGYWEVWLNPKNSWIYPHLHTAAQRMAESARRLQNAPTPNQERLLRQMARELLLAQSSDWAFLMTTGTAPDYSTARTKTHLLRFTELYEVLQSGNNNDILLQEYETCDNLFPNLNWRHYILP